MTQSWTIAILCYNEENSIRDVCLQSINTIQKINPSQIEVILVDDCSIDNSRKEIEKLVIEYSFVKAIYHSENKGVGGASRSAYANAMMENIYVISGDGEADVEELLLLNDFDLTENQFFLFERCVKTGYDVKRLLLTTFNKLLNFVLFGVWLDDINWNKVVKKSQIDSIDLTLDSVLIDSEIVLKLLKKKYKLIKITSKSFERTSGEAKGGNLKSIILSLREVFKLCISLRKQH